MTVLTERLRPEHSTLDFWHGIIHASVTDLSARLSVVVPDFDPTFVWHDCRWQSRDLTTMPQQGDECLIVLSNRQEPWVIAWWPFV